MGNLKNVVYLSRKNYQDLINYGQVTVNGVTVQYSDDDIHIVPAEDVYSGKLYRHIINFGYDLGNCNFSIINNRKEAYSDIVDACIALYDARVLGDFDGAYGSGFSQVLYVDVSTGNVDMFAMAESQSTRFSPTSMYDDVTEL